MIQTVLLGDVVRINPTTTLKKGTTSKFVSMDKLDPFKRKISSHEEREYKGGSKFMNRDTLLARITPCLENGKTAFVDVLEDDEVGAGSTEFIVLRAVENITDPDYIYYLSISPDFRSFTIQAMIGTSGRQRVQNDVLSRYKFELPDIETQQKIGEQLRTLDEKIELNRQMNETLEQMGHALFRHYFIDNPEAEKWKVGYLSSQVDIRYGKNLPTKNLQESGYPVFGGNGQIGYYEKYIYEDPMVLVACRGAASGDINISKPKSFVTNNSLALEIKPSSDFTFEYMRFYSYGRKNGYREFVSGSAQPQITVESLSRCQIPIPPKEPIVSFTSQASTLVDQMRANSEQIQTLTTLRDTLLPRLISGKVTV